MIVYNVKTLQEKEWKVYRGGNVNSSKVYLKFSRFERWLAYVILKEDCEVNILNDNNKIVRRISQCVVKV